MKPLLGTIEYGTENKTLLKGIAAALKYTNDTDPQAVELQTSLKQVGVKKTLAKYAGLAEDSAEVAHIETLYNQL